ncbi:hypothetical protein JQ582_42435 [Bradyrhizobium japonicum]|jgi:hypothetical protein|uniref:hypothetical protein n=1 Tax=Bradyrhizobium japonicum TaxID=375 RepID=UPI001BA6CE24|nr:hypothetical protein [Bradyrhizobium japonicum]MBR0728640.1 hypothetical protein [Bradyrhizobium japonicum]MBR0750549.1 hypothetical protein [Bradyrhizobium japonicum]MBR0806725.1 hypothetical protein [Bradyrhizobium japonicum]MCP1766055.1 hypothetical protein [Bradyrhizobium japonicum]MCP1788192.1 hypothetical protein [Bradyrhizobium japonicum]
MTENAQRDAARRNRLLEAAQKELARFEQAENQFRKKDQAERAAELRLPLRFNIH